MAEFGGYPSYHNRHALSIMSADIMSHASANVKSAWQEMSSNIGGLAYDGLRITHSWFGATAADRLFDIGIGPSGSEVVVVPDLYSYNVGGTSYDRIHEDPYDVPVVIPAYSRLVMRHSANSAGAKDGWTQLFPIADGNGRFSGCFTLGADAANSRGLAVTMGINSVIGSWVVLTNSSPNRIKSFSFDFPRMTAANSAFHHVAIGIGPSGSEQTVWYMGEAGGSTALGCNSKQHYGPYPLDLPAGSRICVRMMYQANAASTGYFVFHGYY